VDLRKQVIDVAFDRAFAHDKMLGDFDVGEAPGDEGEDLGLTGRKPTRK